MALLEMRYEPDPILREKAKRIRTFDGNLRKLVEDMSKPCTQRPVSDWQDPRSGREYECCGRAGTKQARG